MSSPYRPNNKSYLHRELASSTSCKGQDTNSTKFRLIHGPPSQDQILGIEVTRFWLCGIGQFQELAFGFWRKLCEVPKIPKSATYPKKCPKSTFLDDHFWCPKLTFPGSKIDQIPKTPKIDQFSDRSSVFSFARKGIEFVEDPRSFGHRFQPKIWLWDWTLGAKITVHEQPEKATKNVRKDMPKTCHFDRQKVRNFCWQVQTRFERAFSGGF